MALPMAERNKNATQLGMTRGLARTYRAQGLDKQSALASAFARANNMSPTEQLGSMAMGRSYAPDLINSFSGRRQVDVNEGLGNRALSNELTLGQGQLSNQSYGLQTDRGRAFTERQLGQQSLDNQRQLGQYGLQTDRGRAFTERQLGQQSLGNQRFGLDTQRQLGQQGLANQSQLGNRALDNERFGMDSQRQLGQYGLQTDRGRALADYIASQQAGQTNQYAAETQRQIGSQSLSNERELGIGRNSADAVRAGGEAALNTAQGEWIKNQPQAQQDVTPLLQALTSMPQDDPQRPLIADAVRRSLQQQAMSGFGAPTALNMSSADVGNAIEAYRTPDGGLDVDAMMRSGISRNDLERYLQETQPNRFDEVTDRMAMAMRQGGPKSGIGQALSYGLLPFYPSQAQYDQMQRKWSQRDAIRGALSRGK